MRGFEDNNCRLCDQVFCCRKCRLKHENQVHKVYPDCDICIYGKLILENLEDVFLSHLESFHFPLICVYCKRVFKSVEEILQHKKCPVLQTKDDSPKTPFRCSAAIFLASEDQDSPTYEDPQGKQFNPVFHLATSTPMHKGEDIKLLFEKSKEAVTPVDKPISNQISKSIIKKSDSYQSSKRRVTFSDTPGSSSGNRNMKSTPTIENKILSKVQIESGLKILPQKPSDCLSTPVTGTGRNSDTETGQFYSAKAELTADPWNNKQHNSRKMKEETPVAAPSSSKILVSKGSIYRNTNMAENESPKECPQIRNDDLSEVSMELCTPAKPSQLKIGLNKSEIKSKTDVHSSKMETTFSPNESATENKKNIDSCTAAKILQSDRDFKHTTSLKNVNICSVLGNDNNKTDEEIKENVDFCSAAKTPKLGRILKPTADLEKREDISSALDNQETSLEFMEEEKKENLNFYTPAKNCNLEAVRSLGKYANTDSGDDTKKQLIVDLCTPAKPSLEGVSLESKSNTNTEEDSCFICNDNLGFYTPAKFPLSGKIFQSLEESKECKNIPPILENQENSIKDTDDDKENQESVNTFKKDERHVNNVEVPPNISLQDSNQIIIDLCTPDKNLEKMPVSSELSNKMQKDVPFKSESKVKEETAPEIPKELTPFKKSEEAAYNTLWMSAINLEDDTGDIQEKVPSKTTNPVSLEVEGNNKTKQEKNGEANTPESPKINKKRVSIVMPTPILKRTNVKMKFHFPAHLSSTPIISNSAVKLKQTEIVEEISTKVVRNQTPFHTPRGKFSNMVQSGLVKSSNAKFMPQLTCDEDVSKAGPSKDTRDLVPMEAVEGNSLSSRDENHFQKQDVTSSISVSSMTESTFWTSMSRIVRSVLGGFTNNSLNSSSSSNAAAVSFKRQLSDSETGDFLEAPRLKRFKFTDIKCRRPIRDLTALELPHRLPRPSAPLASIEIVKSVSTLYGGQIRLQCDKATQTDDYLMYGWHPTI